MVIFQLEVSWNRGTPKSSSISVGFSIINHGYWGFPMVFLWFSYGFPMVFLWFSYGFPMVFLWFSYGFPMVFLWFGVSPLMESPTSQERLVFQAMPGIFRSHMQLEMRSRRRTRAARMQRHQLWIRAAPVVFQGAPRVATWKLENHYSLVI